MSSSTIHNFAVELRSCLAPLSNYATAAVSDLDRPSAFPRCAGAPGSQDSTPSVVVGMSGPMGDPSRWARPGHLGHAWRLRYGAEP